MHRIERHDLTSFVAIAAPWLMRDEAEHSLLLGIVSDLGAPRHRYDGPPYLVVVRDGERLVGCAFRTPPYKLGLTRMPAPAAAAVAGDAAALFPSLPAVMGPPEAAMAFAEAWCARHGTVARPGMLQGIYELTAVRAPGRRPAGCMRIARPDELALLTQWAADFAAEAAVAIGDPARAAAHFIDRSEAHVWDDGGARCMAVAAGATPTGIRIGFVYTPPTARGRGYATALVADLSTAQLRAGRRACFLYTDLANPTSNGIYERIGYRRVAEVIEIEFGDRRT